MTGEKVNRDRLRPIQQLRFDIKSAAIAAADSSSSWAEFQYALETHGIEACFSINRSTGEIRGISFAKDGYKFAGSKLSKQKLTYGKLVTKFETLPFEGVDVLSTLSIGHRLNFEVGTGKLTAPSQCPIERVYALQTPSRDQPVTSKDASKTEKLFQGVLPNSTPTEPSRVSLIPLSVIINFLAGPAVMQSFGGGGTSNDLDWNDERRRREKAREKQYIHKPFKRRR